MGSAQEWFQELFYYRGPLSESGLPGDWNEAGRHGSHFLWETSLRVEMTFHNCPKDPVNGLVAWNGHIQDEEMPEKIIR